MAAADYRVLTDATGQRIATALEAFQAVPYVATIPTGQWSGSGSDRYITVQASNVTANSILIPNYDNASAALLNGPVWCVPAAGSFTIHTSAIPSGTVTIMVQLVGTLGEAQYQVLADVYSKSQVDSIVAQSTASLMSQGTITVASGVTDVSSILRKTGNIVSLAATLQRVFTGTAETVTLCTLPAGFRPNQVVRGAAYNGTKDVALVYSIQLNGDVMVIVSPQTVEARAQNIMINASFGI